MKANKALINKIRNLYQESISETGHEPNYAVCELRYNDDLTTFEDIISFKEFNSEDDDKIFYYVYDLEELLDLTTETEVNDFIFTDTLIKILVFGNSLVDIEIHSNSPLFKVIILEGKSKSNMVLQQK